MVKARSEITKEEALMFFSFFFVSAIKIGTEKSITKKANRIKFDFSVNSNEIPASGVKARQKYCVISHPLKIDSIILSKEISSFFAILR